MADFAVPDSLGQFRELFEMVVAYGDPSLADDRDANRRLVLAGYWLAAKRADALGREMRAIDVEYGLALLCKWPIKPEIDPALLDEINPLRAEIVSAASEGRDIDIDPGSLTLTLDELYDRLGSEGPPLTAAYERESPKEETQGQPSTRAESSTGAELRTLSVGESLVGDGAEVAHIDALIGPKDGPVGEAFAGALLNQKEGHTNLLAVVAPNLPAKPDTIIANKVTMKGEKQVGQMFGPAQAAVARGVVDSVRDGVIPQEEAEDLCIIVGVFIHWEAQDDKKIFDWNYQATKEAIARAMAGEPTASTVTEQEAAARRPFAFGVEA